MFAPGALIGRWPFLLTLSIWLLLWLPHAAAETAPPRILVVTNSISATQQAARLYVHGASLASGQVLPGPAALAGDRLIQAPVLSSQGRHAAFLTSGGPPLHADGSQFLNLITAAPLGGVHVWLPGHIGAGGQQTLLSLIEDAPFLDLPNAAPPLSPHPKLTGLAEISGDSGMLTFSAAHQPDNGGVVHEARLLMQSDEGLSASRRWVLPGRPAAWQASPPGNGNAGWFILCDAPGGEGAVLTRLHPQRPSLTGSWPLPLPVNGGDVVPRAMALDAGGNRALAALSGFRLDDPNAPPATWLFEVVFEGEHAGVHQLPMELPGQQGAPPHSLVPGRGGSFWVASVAPASGFAYVHCLERDPGSSAPAWRVAAQLPLAGAGDRVLLAPHPEEPRLALAYASRVQVVSQETSEGQVTPFGNPVRALCWTSRHGLLVGEGNRVHAVDPDSGETAATLRFNSGQIAVLVPLPLEAHPPEDWDGDGLDAGAERRRNTQPRNPDSDGDGIHDGIDPEPLRPSPRLEVPLAVSFRGGQAGRAVRALMMQPRGAVASTWRLRYGEDEAPWLRIRPLAGSTNEAAYMGVDPAWLAPGSPMLAPVTVQLDGAARGYAAAESPTRVWVRVQQDSRAPRELLWIWDDMLPGRVRDAADPRGLRALAELLASPPWLYSQREEAGPLETDLDRYAVVIVSARAAARGAITRQAMLEYVANGGAMLFLGAHLAGSQERALRDWLAPAGITLDTGAEVAGQYFSTPEAEGPAAAWQGFAVQNGCLVRAEAGPGTVPPPPGREGVALAVREYGYGRMAVLAAPTPLISENLGNPAHGQFAEALFQWLSRAGVGRRDTDGDGLTDGMEDRNGNGRLDPGETHYLYADTDGDGLWDSLEDRNLNGRVDDGETDPRNPDSDGDGDWDGADATPSPMIGAPMVAGVEPSSAPAEGGALVVVSGRNLQADTAVWFGGRPAEVLRMVGSTMVWVVTPEAGPRMEGATVDVRVASGKERQEGLLREGFRYEPRSRLRLALKVDEAQGGPAQGWTQEVRLLAETPPGVDVGRLFVMLESAAPESMDQRLDHVGPRARMRPMDRGRMVVSITPEPGERLRSGVVAALRFRYPAEAHPAPPVQGPRVVRSLAANRRGGRLVVEWEESPDLAGP